MLVFGSYVLVNRAAQQLSVAIDRVIRPWERIVDIADNRSRAIVDGVLNELRRMVDQHELVAGSIEVVLNRLDVEGRHISNSIMNELNTIFIPLV